MDFELTDEQRLLAETVNGLLEKRYDANTRLALLEGSEGWSKAMWQQYADLGLLGLPFEEQYGGAGMGIAELAVVMESFGRSLILEPFIATVVLGGLLVAAAGTSDQKADLLPKVTAGDLLLALASTEPQSRWSLIDITTTASLDAGQWTVTGEKIAVLGGDVADRIIVTAKTPEGDIGLFIVDSNDVSRDSYRMQDGLGAAGVLFAQTPAQPLGDAADAIGYLQSVIDVATALLCCEAVGAMDRMLWITVDYLKTREQFGAPIAVFQALQHRASDMYVSLEQARSMALLATASAAGEDVSERRRLVRAAKIQIDRSARHIGQEAIQLHGGIGMTMEYPVGHYVKRTALIAKTFNDTDTLITEAGADGDLVPAN